MQRLILVLALMWSILAVGPLGAQTRAGQFDFYLLALTWMPGWCAGDGDARGDPRCTAGIGQGWAVHGLWPQNADGTWPEYCSSARRDPSRAETAAQLGLFGTAGGAWHQWNKHGRCSGLSAEAYYSLTRQAVEGVIFPPVFAEVNRALQVDPAVIEAAFAEANPALTPARMVTTCPNGRLVEIRLCLTREDLQPMDCPAALTRRECRLPVADLLPLR